MELAIAERLLVSRRRGRLNPRAHAGNPAGVSQMGVSTHFKKEQILRKDAGYHPKPMPATGVPGYFNSAKEGPGSGRTIYRSGGQHQYGSPAPNAVNRSPDPPATGNRGQDILSSYGKDRR